MHHRHRLIVLMLQAASTVAAAEPTTSPTSAVRHAVGLNAIADGARGAGPDYAVRFRADGSTFAAAGGVADALLTLRPIDLSRGGRTLPGFLPVSEPIVDGVVAVYERGPGVCEEWRLSVPGVELRVVFQDRPAGDGDLIARYRLNTRLATTSSGDVSNGLVLAAGGVPAIMIGGVTGVDARGMTMPGRMRLDGDELTLSLPAAFVDRAAYPLVLDPLISNLIPLGADPALAEFAPQAAYDVTHDVSLVAWRMTICGVDQIRAQLIGADGELVGGLLILSEDDFDCGDPDDDIIVDSVPLVVPHVANVNLTDRFLVAWGSQQIVGRCVDAVDGKLSPLATLVEGWGPLKDIGGEATLVDNEAILVGVRDGSIMAAQVTVPTSGPPSFLGDAKLGQGSEPNISKSGGASGRYMVAWQWNDRVWGAVIDRNLAVLDPDVAVHNGPEVGWLPKVDGDGERWMVTYFRGEDHVGRLFRMIPAGAISESDLVLAQSTLSFTHDVAWLGDSYLVVRHDHQAGQSFLTASAIEPFGDDVFSCDGPFTFAEGFHASAYYQNLDIAPRRAGGATDPEDRALLTYGGGTSPFDVWAVAYAPTDGMVTNLGGGCGETGRVYTYCPVVGNDPFHIRLRDSYPNAEVVLLLGVAPADIPCGPCSIRVDPMWAKQEYLGKTDPRGDLDRAMPLSSSPTLAGYDFYAQFAVLPPGPPPCSQSTAAWTDAVRFVIE